MNIKLMRSGRNFYFSWMQLTNIMKIMIFNWQAAIKVEYILNYAIESGWYL